jgi:hypothetical protein
MRRNGHTGESSETSGGRSSGWLSTIFSMVGGIGVGAGLLYLLDPDKGQKRRAQILSSASDLASHASDYAGEALGSVGSKIGGALGSARDYASKRVHNVQDYANDRMDDARAFAQKQVFGETRAEHRVGVTICALSSMALGAALMYAFDPASGKNRRRYVREKANDLASQAGTYAKQAGGAIKSGAERMGERMGVGAGNEAQPNQSTI